MAEKQVLVLGDINLDIIVMVDKLPKLGEDVEVKDVIEYIGGSATTTSIYLSLLGVKTILVGSIGNDVVGDRLLGELKEYGIDTSCIIRVSYPTGRVFVVDLGYDRAMMSYRGANIYLNKNYINCNLEEELKKSNLIHISGYTLLKDPQKTTTINIADLAKSNGVQVSFDPGPILARRDRENTLRFIEEYVDLLLLNELEFKSIFNYKVVDKRSLEEVIDNYDLEVLVVKRGSKGSIAINSSSIIECSPKTIDIAKVSVGAGDAFNAGFITAHIDGYDLRGSICIASNLALLRVKGLKSMRTKSIDLKELFDCSRFTLRTFPRSA